MTNTVFITALIAYLGLATALLYRSPTHGWGFSMYIFFYPIFIVAFFFVTARFVIRVWLGLALVNMAIQRVYMKNAGVQKGLAGVMVASLFLWPVQFAATIKGTVSYAHHHGTEEGHDSIWLDEFGDLNFMTDAETFDRIGIAEGKVVSLTIDERNAPAGLEAGTVLWVIDGKSQDDQGTA